MAVLHILFFDRCKTFVYHLDLILTEFPTNSETSEETGYDKSEDDCIESDCECCAHCFLFLRSFLICSIKYGCNSGSTSRKMSSSYSGVIFAIVI